MSEYDHDPDRDEKSREDEPLAEADAAECEVTAPNCEVTATEREGAAHESQASLREEILETFAPQTTVMVPSVEDGMPIPADERPRNSLALAHPFTVDTMCCIEDERSFVEVFVEELSGRAGWRKVERPQGGGYAVSWVPEHAGAVAASKLALSVRSAFKDDGTERQRQAFEPSEVCQRWGLAFVETTTGTLVPVRPVRERCKFYKRQSMANDDAPEPDEPGHFIVFRNCTQRRSVGGAFMTLRDEAVYACEYRDPPDPRTTEKYLDARDRKALASTPEMVQPFNLG